jgi:hypothetical protein
VGRLDNTNNVANALTTLDVSLFLKIASSLYVGLTLTTQTTAQVIALSNFAPGNNKRDGGERESLAPMPSHY